MDEFGICITVYRLYNWSVKLVDPFTQCLCARFIILGSWVRNPTGAHQEKVLNSSFSSFYRQNLNDRGMWTCIAEADVWWPTRGTRSDNSLLVYANCWSNKLRRFINGILHMSFLAGTHVFKAYPAYTTTEIWVRTKCSSICSVSVEL